MTAPLVGDPLAMTTRARVYLAAAGWRHLMIGVSLLLTPWLYGAAAFIPIFNLLPLAAWGVVMTLEGVACGLAAGWRNPRVARGAIGTSAVITLTLAVGLSIGVAVAWSTWVGRIGWPALWELIATHPENLPAVILGVAPAPPSPFLPVIMLALTVKDFAMCAQPLRVPLEESVGDVHPKAV